MPSAIFELHSERGQSEHRADGNEPRTGDDDVQDTPHRVPSALPQTTGVPLPR